MYELFLILRDVVHNAVINFGSLPIARAFLDQFSKLVHTGAPIPATGLKSVIYLFV